MKRLSEESRMTCLLISGVIALSLSLYGAIAILPFDLSRISDVKTAIWLLGPFPIYLIHFWSKRGASIGLWALFFYEWIDRMASSVPPSLLSPLDWSGGVALLIAAVLMTLGAAAPV